MGAAKAFKCLPKLLSPRLTSINSYSISNCRGASPAELSSQRKVLLLAGFLQSS